MIKNDFLCIEQLPEPEMPESQPLPRDQVDVADRSIELSNYLNKYFLENASKRPLLLYLQGAEADVLC